MSKTQLDVGVYLHAVRVSPQKFGIEHLRGNEANIVFGANFFWDSSRCYHNYKLRYKMRRINTALDISRGKGTYVE